MSPRMQQVKFKVVSVGQIFYWRDKLFVARKCTPGATKGGVVYNATWGCFYFFFGAGDLVSIRLEGKDV